MKCLEKEPHNRYESAAALAEDLRRYLDDESILAKPPSTVGGGIKWVRRHPWKFLGATAALLLLVAAVVLLARWELYQRLHTEYATRVGWTNGVLEPLSKISFNAASTSESYVQVTRRGRLGPVIKVEVFNPRGYPAVLRPTLAIEKIPIYIEGISGAQPFAERLPETTTVDFVFDGNDVQEATSRDRNGQVNWRIIYDRVASTVSIVRARFVNLRGFEASSAQRASHMEFERDAKGRDTKVTFFDAAGKPAPNGEGVYGYKMERDSIDRLTSVINLGENGAPVANRADVVAYTLNWSDGIRYEVKDAQGRPSSSKGVSAVQTQLDSAGNPIRVSNLGVDGLPIHDEASSWSVQEMKRNEHGELTQRTYYKADAKGSLQQVRQTDVLYDAHGYPVEIKTANTPHAAMTYDDKGNIIEEEFLNAQGQPMIGEKGYAITRSTYMSTPQGLRIEQTYFDTSGKKTYCVSGYHRLINEFDVTGMLKRLTQDEHDPAKYKYYRYVTEPEYDSQGRSRRNVSRFEDAQGQLATNAGLPYTSEEDSYDEKGRMVSEWKFGADVSTFGGPVVRIDTEWETNGKMKRRVRQICDENRQPIAVIHNGTAARFEEDFDFNEDRERIYETGIDEKMLGFTTREAKFSAGKLESVTFKRTDGSQVSSVAVFITQIIPSENQPKAAEIKAGDQFVAFNGQAVTSAYQFVFAGKFPGGSIEVVRNGQRVRIDGLNAGSLGVVLEDRAVK